MALGIGKAKVISQVLEVTKGDDTPSIVNRPYLGVTFDTNIIYLHKYIGGTYDSFIGSKDYSGILTGTIVSCQVLSLSPLVIGFNRSNGKTVVYDFDNDILYGAFDAVTNGAFTRLMNSDGKNGKCYFTAYKRSEDYYALYQLTSIGPEEISPAALENLSSPLLGSSSGSVLSCGDIGIIPVYGDPGESGYIKVGAFQSEFVPSNDFLPNDPSDGSWLNYIQGSTIPGSTDSLIVNTNSTNATREIGKLSQDAVYTQIIGNASLDTSGVYAKSCDPSSDGETALIIETDKLSHILLNSDVPPVWLNIDNSPLATTPSYMFCLD